MFKSATVYRLLKAADDMADAMDSQQFAPLGASTQDLAYGWVPPRGEEHGALLESVDGFLFAKLAIETKSVPSSEVNKRLEEIADKIEEQTGRKPGKKERRELKEQVVLSLLPNAFPKRKDVAVMIDRKNGYVVMDTTSTTVSDRVVSALVRAGVELALVQTNMPPVVLMANNLLDDGEEDLFFVVGRECQMEAADESKAKVAFKNHHLISDEVRKHIQEGKHVTSLALTDSRDTSFVLTERLQLKKLKFAVVTSSADESQDAFDADALLAGHAISALIADLVKAMGGLLEHEKEKAAA